MFLAMDTVFDQCSIAILDDTGKVVSLQTETGKRMQTQQILPMIDAALSTSQLSLADMQALIFNRGPGAFSGIRINTAVVQALSVAHDVPCVGISSLQAIAQSAYQQYGLTEVYSALDARMQQVYFGHFVVIDNFMQPVHQENGEDSEQLLDGQIIHADIRPDAAIIGQLGVAEFRHAGGTDAAQALPKYLRNQAWKTLKEQGKA